MRRAMTAAVGALVLGLSLVASAMGQPAQTAGMVEVAIVVELSCPSCAQGLERRLGRLDQVERVAVAVDEGRVALTPRPGSSLDLDAVWQQVRNAGFIPDLMSLTAVGTVVERDGERVLVLPGEVLLVMRAGAVSPPPPDERPTRLTGTVTFPGGGAQPLLSVDMVGSS